jgi:hypothetical protein
LFGACVVSFTGSRIETLSGEVERGAATAVNQIINSQARLLELERKIKETEELEARLEALEAVLKARRSG